MTLKPHLLTLLIHIVFYFNFIKKTKNRLTKDSKMVREKEIELTSINITDHYYHYKNHFPSIITYILLSIHICVQILIKIYTTSFFTLFQTVGAENNFPFANGKWQYGTQSNHVHGIHVRYGKFGFDY